MPSRCATPVPFRCNAHFLHVRTTYLKQLFLSTNFTLESFSQVAGEALALARFPWYDGSAKKGALATEYEVEMLALAFVNYGNTVPGAQEDDRGLM